MTVFRARQLRRSMSAPEAVLRSLLRTRPAGCRFRRQHPIGRYVLDFYCRRAMLAIEIDGFAHQLGDNPQRDEARELRLVAQGISTLRIDASDISDNLEGVLSLIVDRCLERTPPPHSVRSPSPAIAGEDDQ